MGREREDEGSGPGIWDSILKEVAHATRVPDSVLLLLGRPGVGKRTLVDALLAHACPAAAAAAGTEDSAEGHSRAVALDYAYFGVRDPELDDAASAPDYVCPAACSALILEDVRHEKLLRSRLLNLGGLRHCAALVCLDLKEPCTMMEDLRQWLELLQRLTAELMQDLPVGEQDELRARISKAMDGCAEPTAGEGDASGAPEDVNGTSSRLAYNLGIPLVVAVTRADGARALESQKTIGWAETIEAHVRSECLAYGATIVFTIVQPKKNSNIDVLYEYLMHRLYGYAFKRQAVPSSRDALFVPSGWDDQSKLDQDSLQRSFESVVVSTAPPPSPPPAPVECDDLQAFLKDKAAVLQNLGKGKVISNPEGGGVDIASLAQTLGKASKPDSSGLVAVGRPLSDDKIAGVPALGSPGAPPTDNSSLANFFNNLLTRGNAGQGRPSGIPGVPPPGGPAGPGAGAGGDDSPAAPASTPVATDAAAAPKATAEPASGAQEAESPNSDEKSAQA